MTRRFSWSAARKRGAEEKDDEVEVVEFFSAATTSESTEHAPEEKPRVKKKQRGKEARNVEAAVERTTLRIEHRDNGDVNLITPPTKRRRMLAQAITAIETLIEVIADEDEVLSTRLEYCSNLWRFVREMPGPDVVQFVRERSSSIVRVIEALLRTGYFPLQQLCFMTVAAILHQLHHHDTEVLAAFVVSCKQLLSENEVDLLELLPLSESIPWHDPRVARQRIVQINRRTGICNSFRASRCWVSPSGKQELARIRVNKWVDIGSTTTTFYWRDENDVVVVNIPHSCVEDVEVERENCILYIWTKHIDRLKGVRLLAFASTDEDFPGFVKALVGIEIEGYEEPPNSPSPIAVELGSPIQTIKTTSTLMLQDQATPVGARITQDETESRSLGQLELDAVDSDSFEPTEDNSDAPEAVELDPATSIHATIGTVQANLSEELAQARRRSEDSLGTLHERLDTSRARITETFSRVSSAQIEAHDVIADKEYKLRATVDILQKKRILDLPHAESIVENEITQATAWAEGHVEDTLNYTADVVIPDQPDFVFTTTSAIMLLIVVIPWVLFAALHSGTDLASVRQLATDAMVLLTAALRKIAE